LFGGFAILTWQCERQPNPAAIGSRSGFEPVCAGGRIPQRARRPQGQNRLRAAAMWHGPPARATCPPV